MQGMWQSVQTIFSDVWPNVTSATYAVSLQYLTDSVLAVRNKYLSLLLLSVFGQQQLHSTRSYCMLIQSQSRETKRLQRQTVIRPQIASVHMQPNVLANACIGKLQLLCRDVQQSLSHAIRVWEMIPTGSTICRWLGEQNVQTRVWRDVDLLYWLHRPEKGRKQSALSPPPAIDQCRGDVLHLEAKWRSEIEKWQLSIHTHILNPWFNAFTTYTIHHSFYVTLMCRQTSDLMLQCCISAQFLRLEFFLSLYMYLILDDFPQRYLFKTWEPIWYEMLFNQFAPHGR